MRNTIKKLIIVKELLMVHSLKRDSFYLPTFDISWKDYKSNLEMFSKYKLCMITNRFWGARIEGYFLLAIDRN